MYLYLAQLQGCNNLYIHTRRRAMSAIGTIVQLTAIVRHEKILWRNARLGPQSMKMKDLDPQAVQILILALRYLGQIRPGPSARMSMLDAICSLFVSQSSAKTWR
jgi:hypothetical protein